MARRKSGYTLKAPVPHHQWSADALALLEDVPIRVFDPAKIIRLPAVFLGLLNRNRDLAKNYRQRFGTDLKDGFPAPIESLSRLTQSEDGFDQYVDWYLERIEGLLVQTTEELEPVVRGHEPGSFRRADAADQARIAAAIESEVFERCVELRDDAAAARRRTLRFLQPYLDLELWLTDTSNALPIELLFQLTPTWRWYSLLWVYRAVRDHRFSADAVLPAWGFPGLAFRLCRFDEHRVALVGPVYESQEAANRATFIRRHADSLKFFFETFHRASSDYFISHAPSIADVSHALSKRNLFDGDLVTEKLDRLTTAMSWVRFADVDEVSRGGMLTLAVVAGFCARQQDIMPMDAELVFSVYAQDDGGCEVAVSWGDGAPSFSLRHVDYAVAPGVRGFGAKHLERRFLEVVDQMRTSTRAQNAIRGQMLYNWLEKHFGTLTLDRPAAVSQSDFAERAHIIENSTMEAIAATFRAQSCTLFWRDYGALRPLVVRGAFSVNPRDLLSLEQRLNDANAAWLAPDGEDASFIVRAMRTRAPVYCADVRSTTGRGRGSAYCYPLMVNDRVVGVLEIAGTTVDQFRWTDRYEFHDINAMIVPIFYQRQVFASLDQIYSAFVNQADRLPPDGVVDRRTGDTICAALSEIFLADVSNLWVRDRANLTKFILTGSTHRRYLEIELPDALNYRGEYQIIFDREFLDSIPNYVSLEFDESIEHDRVLIEGERYRAGRERMRQSPVLEVIVGKWDMREQLLVAVRTESDSVPRAFLALHQDAAKNVPGMWDSIVELVRRQMLSGFSVLGVTETEQRQTTRFIHHEIRHDINQIIALSTKLRGEVRSLRRDFDELYSLLGRDSSDDDFENRLGETQQQLDNLKALRHSDDRDVADATAGFLSAALTLEPDIADLLKRAHRTYANQEKDLDQLSKMQDALDLKREMLQTAQRVRLSDLFGDRAESVDLELVDVFDTVKGVLRTYESRLKSKGCWYEFSIRDNPRIEVVREPFLRIVTNLVDNAWKYSLDNSVVEVTWVTGAQRQGVDTQWSLAIATEGPPTGESFQPFEYGVRGANAEEAETPGEGVGLFVVSQAARFLGLQVDYSQYDQGQRHWHEFTIRKGARG